MVSFKSLGRYGRLGNCLFQMAATIALADRHNDSFAFPPWERWRQFRIPEANYKTDIHNTATYEEPHYHYAEIPYRANLDLHGYFQSPRYFAGQEDLILRSLSPRLTIKPIDACAVHIRRGDYLKLGTHYNILTKDHYLRAMELMAAERYMIFSDDPKWCREQFKGARYVVQHTEPVNDLAHMIACREHVIANSSYSWWGAWLSRQAGISMRVLAPAVWFGPALPHCTKDLLPVDWIKI